MLVWTRPARLAPGSLKVAVFNTFPKASILYAVNVVLAPAVGSV